MLYTYLETLPNYSPIGARSVIHTLKSLHRLGGSLLVMISAQALVSCTHVSREANTCNGSTTPTERLFLQQITPHSAIVKWRGQASTICLGTSPETLGLQVNATFEDGHHVARLTGLQADSRYYYSIGAAPTTTQKFQFRTAPAAGNTPADGNIHILLLGDSGTATEEMRGHYTHPGEALEIKQGFLSYNNSQAKSEPLDLLLLLGDNAYLSGTDEQWQKAFFDIYPDFIRTTATWPTIGNHEMGVAPLDICLIFPLPNCGAGPVVMPLGGVSESADANSYDGDGDGPDPDGLPYLNIFSLPDAAQAGGIASGTEQYYSFDYGNVHVVSLDSQLSNRDATQRATMRQWLVDDLSNNKLDWTVVIFHHPPYSKGENHDSNLEQAEIDMRTGFAPVFEDYGVDVVYSGHAHSYERSWYLHGHYGSSESFVAEQHTQLNALGKPALGQGDETYRQISADTGQDDKAVYTVAGTAGKADEENPCPEDRSLGCTPPDWLMHPAHREFPTEITGARRNGLARKGVVVLDITKTTLTSRFVDEHGAVLDHFTISR